MNGFYRRLWRVSLGAGVLMLAGCGGGDNGPAVQVVPSPPTASPSPAPSGWVRTAEYDRSSAAVAMGADAAYRAGFTGRGVRLAVIDTGLAATLSEFAGKILPESRDVVGSRGVVDQNGHGTLVSAIALARADGAGMHGVAYDADLISLNVSRPGECSPSRCGLTSGPVVRAIDVAIAARARVINLSLGGDGIDPNILAATQRAADAGIVIVTSAENGRADLPPAMAREMAVAGRGHVIITGAHDRSGGSVDGRAGTGPWTQWFVTALGAGVATIDRDGRLEQRDGTSAATAAVSGAVALIAQARPSMTGAQIVALLLRTAHDAGAPGVDPVYGNGIVSIPAAVQALPPA